MTALPLTYYAQFRDDAGHLVTGTDGQTWFAIGGVGTDIQQTANAGAASSPVLNPLTFTLGTDTIVPALLTAEAVGTTFRQIELAGYSGTGSSAVLVTDAVYKAAAVQALTFGDTGAAVAMEYGDTVQRFYPTDANGNVLAPTVAGYNDLTGQSDTSTNYPNGLPGNAPAAPLTGTPPTTDTTAPLTFYVQFRDASGTALASSTGQTWFAISNLAVPSEQLLHVTNAGLGAGTITFDPLTFTIDGATLPALLARQSSATVLGAVEIAGYSGTGATALLAEDFIDRNARVATLAYGSDGSQTVALQTTDLVQSVIPPTATGSGLTLPVAVTAGWNQTTNMADNTADTRAGAIGTPTATPAAALTYYVQFRNGSGALLAGNGGQTWFAASAVGFGSTQTFNASGAATGLGFDPLTLTSQPDSILVKLFAGQAAGTPLQQIELAGYDASGTLVSDDAFKSALALDDVNGADGAGSLTFGYSAFTQTTFSTDLLGQTTPSTQGYNIVSKSPDTGTNTAGGAPGHALDAPAGAPPPTNPGPGSLTYYVQFRSGNGTLLTGTGGSTWFAVTNVGFDTTQTLSASQAPGKVSFGALSFTTCK